VSGSRTIAPDRRRLREATRAGIRRQTRWLGRGLICLGVVVVVRVYGAEASAWIDGALHSQTPQQLAQTAALTLGVALLALLGIGALMLLSATGLSGGLGPIDDNARRRLGPVGVGERRPPWLWWAGLALVGISLARHLGVIAGASRAVESSPTALAELWWSWGLEVLTIAGGLLIVGGLVELWIDEQARRRALHRSPEELREELRSR